MTDHITLTGTLGTEPELRQVGADNNIIRLTFRLASSERRQNRDGEWEDVHTNWYSVTAFGRLAMNAHGQIAKGQRVILTGKQRVTTFDRQDGSKGNGIEVIATHIGRDLAYSLKPKQEADAPTASEEEFGGSPAAPAVGHWHTAGLGQSQPEAPSPNAAGPSYTDVNTADAEPVF